MRKQYHELDDADLARICHEAHLAFRITMNDSATDVHWDALSQERRDLVTDEVRRFREGQSLETVHANWVNWMLERGWRLPQEDEPQLRDTARKIHPSLVPYADLPVEEQAKVRQAQRIVFTHVIPDVLEEIAYQDLRTRGWSEISADPVFRDDGPVVCVTHMRFAPCREEGRWCEYSEAQEDVERVSEHQKG